MTKPAKDNRTATVRIIGLCVAALTVFLAIASVSYLFHWQEDMSLAGNAAEHAGNAAGRLGNIVASFFVAGIFGIGSFALIACLGTVSFYLIANRRPDRLFHKINILCASGGLVLSLLCAFAGMVAGIPDAFGNGMGGAVGDIAVKWSSANLGMVVSGLLIAIILVCWLFFCPGKMCNWLGRPYEPRKRRSVEEIPNRVQDDEVPFEPEPEPEPEIEEETFEEPEVAEVPAAAIPETGEGIAEPGLTIVEDNGLDVEIKEPLKPIDNRLDPPEGLPKFKFPPLTLLESYADSKHEVPKDEIVSKKDRIKETLANYKIQIVEVTAIVGSTVTLYKVFPAPGVQIAQIKRLQEDIGMSLKAKGVRISTLPDSVGIEVANEKPSIVPIRALLNDESFRNSKAELPVAIGYTIQQKVKVFDLTDAPHLLIAGATKQGKSVGLNVIINSLLYSKHPSELKFVFIDPKMVEFSAYSQLLRHYLAVLPSNSEEEEEKNAIVKLPKDAETVLKSLCIEMDNRYRLFTTAGNGVNNIKEYNKRYVDRKLNPNKGHYFMPYLVVVVDEYADLTMTVGASRETRASSNSITNSIIRLAQKGRAAGIHVILATQRPSVNVISGLIKSNFPMRIAFRVASRIDSMTILDAPGAEKLIGKGDMLFSAGIDSERIQCGYISGDEIDTVAEFISEQKGYGKCYNTPFYLPEVIEENSGEGGAGMVDMHNLDARFEEAANLVVTTQRGSTSDLQRKLGMGYAKAGRVMDQLEAAGIVGPQEGSKPRQVLVSDLASLQEILDSYMK